MGEIKSTLDLVMERTRNLTLSADEKKNQEIDAARKNFNGAVQKYLDRALKLDELRRELAELQEKYPTAGVDSLRDVLLERIEPDTIDCPLPDLLHVLFGCPVEGVKRLGQEYLQQMQSRARHRTEELKRMLDDRFRISGSAVVPNLEADSRWQQDVQELRNAYMNGLRREKALIQDQR